MTDNQQVWFIINFFSGTLSIQKKEAILEKIKQIPDSKLFLTQYPNHASELAQRAIDNKVAKVVAVGGDGTLNEVGSVLMGTSVKMGIVPIGSGNGLARHLKIPLDAFEAINLAIDGNVFEIDTCTINEINYFCTAGVGFDAQVALDFSLKKSRGFLTYIITSIQSFFKFKPSNYTITFGGNQLNVLAFAVTFANASQYGNDAVVAPDSEIDDGLIDMVILRPFPLWYASILAFRLFTNSFSRSRYVTTYQGKEFAITSENNLIIHYDGEPKSLDDKKLFLKISPHKLKVICNRI